MGFSEEADPLEDRLVVLRNAVQRQLESKLYTLEVKTHSIFLASISAAFTSVVGSKPALE